MAWIVEGNIQGPQGDDGLQGDQGVQGPIGPDGIQGIQGEEGDQGIQGPAGTQILGTFGDVRIPGELPADGLIPADWDGPGRPATSIQFQEAESLVFQPIAGDTDPEWGDVWTYLPDFQTWSNLGKIQGPQGPQGDTGPQGVEGPQGDQGIQGIQGPIGDDGPQGPLGPEGPLGPQGDDGDRGSLWYTGVGPPSSIIGETTADMYLDNNNGDVYRFA